MATRTPSTPGLILTLSIVLTLGCQSDPSPDLSASLTQSKQGLSTSLMEADAILGQVVSDATSTPIIDNQSLNEPTALALIEHHLLVIDSGNERILGFRATLDDGGSISMANAASLVIGQRDFFHADGYGLAVGQTIVPAKLAVGPEQELYVSGRDHEGESVIRIYDNPFEHDSLADAELDWVPEQVASMTLLGNELLLVTGGSHASSESLYFYATNAPTSPPYQQLTVDSPCNERGGIQGVSQVSGYLLVACSDVVMVGIFGDIPGYLTRDTATGDVVWNVVYEGINAVRGLDGIIASEELNELFVVDSGNHRVVPLRNPSFHIQSVLAEIRGTYNVALEFSEFIGQPSPEGTSANNHPNLDAAGSPSEFGLSSPSAIAWREGYLWVADRDNHRVLRFSTDESSTESPARATAVLGQADAFHSYPNRVDGRSILGVSDLAIVPAQGPSSSEALWIVDREGHRVLIHDDIGAASDGQAAQDVRGQIGLLDYLPNRGTEASGQSLNSPSCMSVSQNSQRVAICDSGNHRIALMASTDSSRAGAWIVGPLLDPLTSDERLPLHAVSVAFIESAPGAAEPYLHAFVAAGDEQDPRAHRILVYDLSQTIFDEETPTVLDSPSRVIGQPFAEWETAPGYPANFCNQGNAQPSADTLCDLGALTADADGNLWVADAGNHRVLRFQAPSMGSSGIPLGSEGLLEALSADYVLGQVSFDENQSWDGRDITAATSLSSPRGLAVELLTGSLWIAEPETGRVLRFAAPFVSGDSPSLDASLGRPRAPGTRLDAADVISPIAVSSSRAGDVVVIADAATNRVMRYTFNQAPTLTVGDGQYSYQVEEGTLGEAVRLTFSDPEGDGLIFDAEAIRAGLPGAISLNESDGSWQLRVDATELVAGQQVYAHLWLYDTSARANRSEALIAFKIIAPSRPEQTGAPDSSHPPAPERIAPPVTKNGCQGTESPLLSALLLGLFLIHSRRRVFG